MELMLTCSDRKGCLQSLAWCLSTISQEHIRFLKGSHFSSDETRNRLEKNVIPILVGSDRRWRLWNDDVITCAIHKALLGQSC